MTLRGRPFLTVPATLLALAAAALLGACGVRGPLEPPTQAQTQGEKTMSAEAGAAGENSAAKPKPHEDFILDPLLR